MTTKIVDNENKVTICDMLNELKAYKNLNVYVTGGNSTGLSSGIATEFRGRKCRAFLSGGAGCPAHEASVVFAG